MKLATASVSPRLAAAAASRRTEQQARYQRLLNTIADRRARGAQEVRVRLSDLEALIAIAASTDLAVQS